MARPDRRPANLAAISAAWLERDNDDEVKKKKEKYIAVLSLTLAFRVFFFLVLGISCHSFSPDISLQLCAKYEILFVPARIKYEIRTSLKRKKNGWICSNFFCLEDVSRPRNIGVVQRERERERERE